MPMERTLGGELEFFEDYEFETRSPDVIRATATQRVIDADVAILDEPGRGVATR